MQIFTITTFLTLTLTSAILTSNPERLGNNDNRERERQDRSVVWSRGDDSDWNWDDWNESGNWRREHRGRVNGRRGDRGDRDRFDERIRRNGRGRDRPEYEERDDPKSKPKYPISGVEPIKIVPHPFVPFPTEPSIPMPSIIEPYPVIETLIHVPAPVTSYPPIYSQSQLYPSIYYPSSVEYYPTSPSVKYSQVSEVYTTAHSDVNVYTTAYSDVYTTVYSNIYTSAYYPDSSSSSSSVVKKAKVPAISYHSNSTSTSAISYHSTYIKTEAESTSTVTTKVTGRYRAMSNSSSSSPSSNIAGSISFSLVLLSSLFLLTLV